jgi:hypothetical protein
MMALDYSWGNNYYNPIITYFPLAGNTLDTHNFRVTFTGDFKNLGFD